MLKENYIGALIGVLVVALFAFLVFGSKSHDEARKELLETNRIIAEQVGEEFFQTPVRCSSSMRGDHYRCSLDEHHGWRPVFCATAPGDCYIPSDVPR